VALKFRSSAHKILVAWKAHQGLVYKKILLDLSLGCSLTHKPNDSLSHKLLTLQKSQIAGTRRKLKNHPLRTASLDGRKWIPQYYLTFQGGLPVQDWSSSLLISSSGFFSLLQ